MARISLCLVFFAVIFMAGCGTTKVLAQQDRWVWVSKNGELICRVFVGKFDKSSFVRVEMPGDNGAPGSHMILAIDEKGSVAMADRELAAKVTKQYVEAVQQSGSGWERD
jgi:hypothetical protein